MDQTEHNLRQQTELYGEPLGDLMRRIGGTLGQRVKIGNPAVVSRLHSLDLLVKRVTEEGLEEPQIAVERCLRQTTRARTRAP